MGTNDKNNNNNTKTNFEVSEYDKSFKKSYIQHNLASSGTKPCNISLMTGRDGKDSTSNKKWGDTDK